MGREIAEVTVLEGKLQRNESGRFEVEEFALTSGHLVEIKIAGQWCFGIIEYWRDDYHWFSRPEGIPVILHNGVRARIKFDK